MGNTHALVISRGELDTTSSGIGLQLNLRTVRAHITSKLLSTSAYIPYTDVWRDVTN